MRLMVCDRGTAEPISLGAALLSGKKVAPDVTALLMEDHRTVMGWFDCYENAADSAVRAEVTRKIALALLAHMAAEEEIFYPQAEAALGDDALLAQAYKEHAGAKEVLRRIGEEPADSAEHRILMRELRQELEAHILEEETVLFPRVRASGLDLYLVGGLAAARRAERLFELRGGDHALKEMPKMPIDPSQAREFFVTGLRNLHATATQCQTMVRSQVNRLENYPAVRARLEVHLDEKKAQLSRLDDILRSLDEEPSSFNDTAMSMMGNMGTMMNAAAEDEVIKNGLSLYALANFEAAAYETAIAFGEAAQRLDALRPLQMSLNEERAIAAYMAENMRGTGLRFLQLRSEERQASH